MYVGVECQRNDVITQVTIQTVSQTDRFQSCATLTGVGSARNCSMLKRARTHVRGKWTCVSRGHERGIVFSHVQGNTKVQVRKWEAVRSLTLSITVSLAYARRATSRDVESVERCRIGVPAQGSNQTWCEYVLIIYISLVGQRDPRPE